MAHRRCDDRLGAGSMAVRASRSRHARIHIQQNHAALRREIQLDQFLLSAGLSGFSAGLSDASVVLSVASVLVFSELPSHSRSSLLSFPFSFRVRTQDSGDGRKRRRVLLLHAQLDVAEKTRPA